MMNNTTERSMYDAVRLEQVAEIVSAYVSNNALSPADLPKLIAETYGAAVSFDCGFAACGGRTDTFSADQEVGHAGFPRLPG